MSEYFLKIALTDDVLSRIQIKAEVAESGFVWAKAERDVPWSEVFSSDKDIDCIVRSPEAFRQSVWPHLLAAAKSRTIHLQVFICAPPGPGATITSTDQRMASDVQPAIEDSGSWLVGGVVDETTPLERSLALGSADGIDASSLNIGSAQYRFAKSLESTWRRAKASRDVAARCELRVAVAVEPAECAVVATNSRQVVVIGRPQESHEDGIAMMFEKDSKSVMAAWAQSVVRWHAEVANDVWTDMKKKGSL